MEKVLALIEMGLKHKKKNKNKTKQKNKNENIMKLHFIGIKRHTLGLLSCLNGLHGRLLSSLVLML